MEGRGRVEGRGSRRGNHEGKRWYAHAHDRIGEPSNSNAIATISINELDYAITHINARIIIFFFFFQAEDGIRDKLVTGVQTCALPILALQLRIMPDEPARRLALDIVEKHLE